MALRCHLARKNRVPKSALKKIPTKKYQKTDKYDTCPICLNEYEEGVKIRLLPCEHIYHMDCIDKWLLRNNRFCPVCKRRVLPGGESDSENETSTESTSSIRPTAANNNNQNEEDTAPILANDEHHIHNYVESVGDWTSHQTITSLNSNLNGGANVNNSNVNIGIASSSKYGSINSINMVSESSKNPNNNAQTNINQEIINRAFLIDSTKSSTNVPMIDSKHTPVEFYTPRSSNQNMFLESYEASKAATAAASSTTSATNTSEIIKDNDKNIKLKSIKKTSNKKSKKSKIQPIQTVNKIVSKLSSNKQQQQQQQQNRDDNDDELLDCELTVSKSSSSSSKSKKPDEPSEIFYSYRNENYQKDESDTADDDDDKLILEEESTNDVSTLIKLEDDDVKDQDKTEQQ
jgi:hypothetical protein